MMIRSRTEKCDRIHYVMAVILFIAILAVTPCTIATPEKGDNK